MAILNYTTSIDAEKTIARGFKGVIVKQLNEMNLEDCKTAFNVRLIENNKHPNSAFKKFIDEEMILIKDRIKYLRSVK